MLHTTEVPDDWLSQCAYDERLPNFTSQRGEDRILQALFEKIGVTNRWCVEFGAADGKHRSNTWALINHQQWSSVQIEAARDIHLGLRTPWHDSFEALQARYRHTDRVTCVNALVGSHGGQRLDVILAGTSLPHEFDLLSIDVDGAEYDIWQALKEYQPRVVLIEHNKTIPIEVIFHSDRGSSLRALAELGATKGYVLAAANDLNGVFVLQSEFSKLGIRDHTPERLWRDHEQYRMYARRQVDGTLCFFGPSRVRWVRGADGTLHGQLSAGHYAYVNEHQTSLPSKPAPTHPRHYVSGWVRHWLR